MLKQLSLIITLLLICNTVSYAAKPVFEIEIRDHLFLPDVIRIPVDTKVKLLITNSDDTAEDFECYDLNREKMIGGHSTVVIFIGPVRAGEYHFFGEFFPKTAQGKIIVE